MAEAGRERRMDRDRLAAFSDGVFAIIITIMVLDLRTPDAPDFHALATTVPTFFGYVLSFLYVAIYWNNHHHFFQLVERVNGTILWANIHLLFWLSLIPFATGWLGAYPGASAPTALYGLALLMPAIAWYVMQLSIIRLQGEGSMLLRALGRDIKGRLSPPLYAVGVVVAFIEPWIADAIYALLAVMWCVPDRRIEALFDRGPPADR